ncbi:GNAT family N-acetyltransferase [Fulvivirga ulvae]|uniref:GNAT family N-acetyltransferase n=1 Tax=Fulvivirga ulvae TaxID=2904245 RepID=UPI001F36B68F|nr:GNAT family N-acetyltransferase [Fulvivirga ulvae]UII34556.1 GNAT family N-acetyltransferase [Fulvivirga ulvae]
MTIDFIPIKTDDKHTVLNLFKEAAEKIASMNIDHWQYWKNPPAEKVEWVEEGIRNNEFFFVKSGGELIGMVRILEEDWLYWGEQKDKALYVHSLVVKEEYGGKGVGRDVLEKVENRAKAEGCKYLRLDADSKNHKLCGYYEKQGFKKVGIKEVTLSVSNLYEKEL